MGIDIYVLSDINVWYCQRMMSGGRYEPCVKVSNCLSSEQKIRIAALITTGQIKEPVSLDGCESHAKDFTELEMTTYYPVLRRNVKLATIFVPKPGENSDIVEKLIMMEQWTTFCHPLRRNMASIRMNLRLDAWMPIRTWETRVEGYGEDFVSKRQWR